MSDSLARVREVAYGIVLDVNKMLQHKRTSREIVEHVTESLAAAIDEARLEEARWWQSYFAAEGDKRIAELDAALRERGKV